MTGRGGPRPQTHAEVGPVEVAVLLAELLLLAGYAVAGARLLSGAAGIVLAVLLPLVAVTIWALLLAPRATRRLPHPYRLSGKLVLAVVATVLLLLAGSTAWAGVVLVVAGGLFVAGELREQRFARGR